MSKSTIRTLWIAVCVVALFIAGIYAVSRTTKTTAVVLPDEPKQSELQKQYVAKGYTDEVAALLEKNYSQDSSQLLSISYTPNILDYLQQPYFRFANYDRYLEYSRKHPEYPIAQVVNRTNMYLDYDFYAHDIAVDDYSILVLANKYYRLGESYVPKDLVDIPSNLSTYAMKGRREAVAALETLISSMKSEADLTVRVTSAYRSYSYQNSLYNTYVNASGEAAADALSARPGYSEHQTGLAFDLLASGYTLENFYKTPQSQWVSENAYRFGFIIRYQEGKTDITGYSKEEWHLRYVGIDAATYITSHDLTFEEYYMMNEVNEQ